MDMLVANIFLSRLFHSRTKEEKLKRMQQGSTAETEEEEVEEKKSKFNINARKGYYGNGGAV